MAIALKTRRERMTKEQFHINSFQNRWYLQKAQMQPGQDGEISGKGTILTMENLKIILGYEELDSIRKPFIEFMKINKMITHQPFELTVALAGNGISIKKKTSSIKSLALPEKLSKSFYQLIAEFGSPENKQAAADYEINFLFQTAETEKDFKKLMLHLKDISEGWIRQIEEVLNQDFKELKNTIKEIQ